MSDKIPTKEEIDAFHSEVCKLAREKFGKHAHAHMYILMGPEPYNATGDWEITEAQVDKFWAKVNAAHSECFEKDCDGDSPIRIELEDRTKYVRQHRFALRHTHDLKSEKEYDEQIELASSNVRSAIETLDTLLKCRKFQEWKQNE